MITKKLWFLATGFFAGVGMCLAGLVTQAQAQWGGEGYISMSRGQIGHSIHNLGMTGKKDNRSKLGQSGFSYPQGRNIKVYSGGSEREGWNAKGNSAGEGFWILSKTGGSPHGSYAGSRVISSDISGVTHDPRTYPEAYVGVIHDPEWALAIRSASGGQASWTNGSTVAGVSSNWWPESNGVESGDIAISQKPVVVWNFRYGRPSSGESFTSRIASGEFLQYSAPAWAEALSEDDFPEVVATSIASSSDTGLEWTRKWMQWGQNDYDEFFLVDNVIENKSSTTQEDVYMVMMNRFTSNQATGWRSTSWNRAFDWAKDDYPKSTLASNYMDGVPHAAWVEGGGRPMGSAKGKAMSDAGHPFLYYVDGDSDHIDLLINDIGDPYMYSIARERYTREQTWVREGMIQHGHHFGLGVVDWQAPFMRYGGEDPDVFVAPHDNGATPHDESAQQPASITYYKFHNRNDYEHPSPTRDSHAFIYDALTQGGFPDEPDEKYIYSHFMTFGPWTLAPGEKAKVVVSYVAGQASEAPKYDDYKTYPKPFNMGWRNLFGGTGREPVKLADRRGDIPLGEDIMFDHFQNSIDVYNWGYDIPNQPQTVKLAFDSNLQGKTEIRWSSFGEDASDPDYTGAEAQDLRGYRVYRSDEEYHGDWDFVGEFSFEDARSGNLPKGVTYDSGSPFTAVKNAKWPTGIPLTSNKYVGADEAGAGSPVNGVYKFVSQGSNAGFPNWYTVRLYDSGHADWNGTGTAIPVLESAPTTSGGATLGRRTGVVPVVPGAAIFDRLEEQVRVVPNPFKADSDLHTYNRQQNTRFINLPGRCRIDLYDVTGQRVWSIFNDDPLKGEVAWLQFAENRPTNFGEAMFPGIYFWRVTSLMPGSEGKTQSGTFLIIK